MKARKKAVSFIVTVAMVFGLIGAPLVYAADSDATPLPANIENRVRITNNADAEDVVYITGGLRAGYIVRLVFTDASGSEKTYNSAKAKSTSLRFNVPSGMLSDAGGTLQVQVQATNKGWSDLSNDITYKSAPVSTTPKLKNVVVTNNDDSQRGVYDRVNVTGLRSGDVFYVYYEEPPVGGDDSFIAVSTKATTKGTAETELKTPLPAGSIWITVKSTGRAQSEPLEVESGEMGELDSTETPITAAAINNVGASNDKVMVMGLYPGDSVEVMEEGSDTVIGKGKVAARRTEIEITVRSGFNGGKADAGTVVVRVTTTGKTRTTEIAIDYEGELVSEAINVDPVSADSYVMTSGSVTIWNYENKNDEIEIRDLLPYDKLSIKTNPEDPQKEVLIKSISVSAKNTSVIATLKLPDIPEGETTGSVIIYRTSAGMAQSAPVKVLYSLPERSTEPVVGVVSGFVGTRPGIFNSALKNQDHIWITGSSLAKGDKISVYASADPVDKEKKLNAPGSGTINSLQNGMAVVLAQFPTTDAGVVYVSYTKPGKAESERIPVAYHAEIKTPTDVGTFAAVNVAGAKDTLTVTGSFVKGTVIQAYTTNQGVYASSFIKGSYLLIKDDSGSVSAKVTFMLPELAVNATTGTIYIGVTSPHWSESDLIPVEYSAEPVSALDNTSKIAVTVLNHYGNSDWVSFMQIIEPGNLQNSADMNVTDFTISSNNLYPGHTLATAKTVINLYETSNAAVKTKLGSMIIDGKYPTTTTSGQLTIERKVNVKGLSSGGGVIYYTFTYPYQAESERMAVTYSGESQTEALTASAVTVDNRVNTNGEMDYVTVSLYLSTGTVIRIYEKKGDKKPIAQGTVTAAMAAAGEITIALNGKGANILPTSGAIWITAQDPSKSESEAISVDNNQSDSTTPSIAAISELVVGANTTAGGIFAVAVDNKNVTARDVIFVLGLQEEDTVTLSFVKGTRTVTSTAKVEKGQSTAVIHYTIEDAAWNAGAGYITVTKKGMQSSDRIDLSAIRVLGAGW